MVEKDFVPPLDPALTQVPARELVSYESLLIEIEKLCRSECVRTLEYGQTPGRRKIHLLVISSPENLANLDRHKELAVRARRDLVRYRTLGDLEINEKVLAERQANAVPSVLIHCGAFGFEASHVEGGIQLANLLTNGGFPKASQILGNFIVLILPMVDPDGRMLAIKQWQEFPLCPAFAGVGNAQGFFLNRDYHRLSQAETRAVHEVFNEWQPLAALDPHEDMVLLGVHDPEHVCWAPPFLEPRHPYVESPVLTFVNRFGTAIVEAWRQRGFKALHNTEKGALLEMLSLDGRFDLDLDLHGTPVALTESARTPGTQTWQDRVEQKVIAGQSFLECCLEWKDELLSTQHKVWLENSQRGQEQPSEAMIIPKERDEQDAVALAEELIEILSQHGIQTYSAEEPFRSWIIPMGQPDRALIRSMLVSESWNLNSLPPAFGVTSHALTSLPSPMQEKFRRARLDLFDPGEERRPVKAAAAEGWLVDNSAVGVSLVNELLQKGIEVRWNVLDATGNEEGSFIVPSPPAQLPLDVRTPRVIRPAKVRKDQGISLQPCRIALYSDQGVDERNRVFWADSSSALSRMNFTFDAVYARDIQEGKLAEYDALLIPGGDAYEILHGWRTDLQFSKAPWELPGSSQGIGEQGVAKIREFVEQGGMYLGIGAGGGALAAKEYMRLADVSIAAHTLGKARVIIRLKKHPLTAGARPYRMQDGSVRHGVVPAIYFSESLLLTHGGPLFETGGAAESIAVYEDVDYEPWTKLLIGDPAQFRKGYSAIVYQKQGKGRVVLYGISPDFRATWLSTYRFLSNALFLAQVGSDLV